MFLFLSGKSQIGSYPIQLFSALSGLITKTVSEVLWEWEYDALSHSPSVNSWVSLIPTQVSMVIGMVGQKRPLLWLACGVYGHKTLNAE